MTKDDIIRMAREAGWEMDNSCVLEPQVVWYISQGQLELFANLVAAAEREACAKVCNDISKDSRGDWKNGAMECEEAIRARGQ